VLLELDVVGPECTYLVLAGIEVQAAVTALFEVHEYVQIAVAVPVVMVEAVGAVILGIRLDDVYAPVAGSGFADVLLPSVFLSFMFFFGKYRSNSEDARNYDTCTPDNISSIHIILFIMLRALRSSSNSWLEDNVFVAMVGRFIQVRASQAV